MLMNSGNFSITRLRTSESPFPITSPIFVTSPFACCIPFVKSARIGTPFSARSSRNGRAIKAAAFFSPPNPALSCCNLSLKAPSAFRLSPDITAPIASASSPYALKASEPASMIVLSSVPLLPRSVIASASRSVSFSICPNASITSQYTSCPLRSSPFASVIETPSFSYASVYVAFPSRALLIICVFFFSVPVSVFISPSMKLSA